MSYRLIYHTEDGTDEVVWHLNAKTAEAARAEATKYLLDEGGDSGFWDWGEEPTTAYLVQVVHVLDVDEIGKRVRKRYLEAEGREVEARERAELERLQKKFGAR